MFCSPVRRLPMEGSHGRHVSANNDTRHQTQILLCTPKLQYGRGAHLHACSLCAESSATFRMCLCKRRWGCCGTCSIFGSPVCCERLASATGWLLWDLLAKFWLAGWVALVRPCQLVCRPGWQLAIRGSSLDGLWRLAASGVRWMAFVDLLADLTSAFLVGLPWCVLSAGICRPGWHRQSAAPRWMAFGDLLTGCAWLLLSWLRCPGASLSAGMSPRLASAIRSSMDGLWRLADWLCLTSAFKELPGWFALVRRKQLIALYLWRCMGRWCLTRHRVGYSFGTPSCRTEWRVLIHASSKASAKCPQTKGSRVSATHCWLCMQHPGPINGTAILEAFLLPAILRPRFCGRFSVPLLGTRRAHRSCSTVLTARISSIC